MNTKSNPLNRITSLLLAWMVIVSSLAAVPQPRRISDSTRSAAPAGRPARLPAFTPAAAPLFPDCTGTPNPPTCTSLQVFLLIDDSGSMLYTDPTSQRVDGVKNVLDILAREYYLPAVDAQSNDPGVTLPDIQVALIHFSSELLHNSGWKTINPASLSEWNTQLKAFDTDLVVNVDYTRPQNTDFLPAFQAAEALAAERLQAPACPRLVMLFTDGMPDYGKGPLDGADLAKYMQDLQVRIQRTFNRSNDAFFVTTLLYNTTPGSPWNKIYRPKWEEITKDDPNFDPRRVLNVATRELAARMERIIGTNIGDPVSTLSPTAGQPQQYTTEITDTVPVESLRLTYYTINTAASFTVTGPDGKGYGPSGENTSIQVLEIYNPVPGAYQIRTTALGGMLTRLLRFGKITAQLTPPAASLQQFTNAQIGIQLVGADGQALPISPQISLQAAITQNAGSKPLTLTPGSAAFTASWMPVATDSAGVDACVTMKDDKGRQVVLYNGPAGGISIDPVTVQAGQAAKACLPTNEGIGVPLQLVNANTQQPAHIDLPVKWTAGLFPATGRPVLRSSIEEIDAKSGQYVLRFKSIYTGAVQFPVTASAVAPGVNQPFYDGTISSRGLTSPTSLALTLGVSRTLGDRLSVWLYKAFHPACLDNTTQIVIGRHLFGLFGPARIEISGRLVDSGTQASAAGIERFAVQLVSPQGGPSSETLSWPELDPEIGLEPGPLVFRSPGLGPYSVTVSDHGPNPACTVLASLPAQSVLLINDFWEYVVVLVLLLILALLVIYLLRRYRNKRYGHEIPLILSSVVLVALLVILVNLLVTRTFKCQMNCSYLIDRPLNSDILCKGVRVGPVTIIPAFTIPPIEVPAIDLWLFTIPAYTIGPFEIPALEFGPFRILPGLNFIDKPLETVRQAIAWGITLLFAGLSLVLAFLISKVNTFIEVLRSAAGRRRVFTNLSIWLAFFVIFCTLFYFGPGGK